MNKPAAIVVVLSCMAFGLLAQDATLESKVSQLQIGKSTIEDVRRLFGEPESYGAREKSPDRYFARFPNGIRILMSGGCVRSIQIQKPGYRVAGGIQVGSSVAELIQALGAPKEIVKGPTPQGVELQSGVLYEGGEGKPGVYARADLGAAFLLIDGKVAVIVLEKFSKEEASTNVLRNPGPRDPCKFKVPGNPGKPAELPRFDADAKSLVSPGICGMDLAAFDLRERATDLLASNFDRRTAWPAQDRLPEGFDPQRILEFGRNPGLGVRSLHKRGITGRGVSIGLVDNPLRATHKEYASRLRFHEYVNASKDEAPHFHGSFVVSMAAGETVGVAPGADIYYVSSWAGDNEGIDFTPRAKAFDRLLEVNRTLPPGKKIRVISMSHGWEAGTRGSQAMEAAARRAEDEGILVITANLERMRGLKYHGLGRNPVADPDIFESYLPGEFWANRFYSGKRETGRLLAPMDSRTGAGPLADDQYYYSRINGWSWTMPYLAGVYALAAQVDPGITPDRFWETALKTGRTIQVKRGEKTYPLGPIIDPVALIAAIEKH